MEGSGSRRQFLKQAGCVAAGLGCGLPVVWTRVSGGGDGSARKAGKQLGLIVDLEKCREEKVRRACIEACHRAHNVPAIPDREEEVKWIWEEAYLRAFPEQAHGRLPLAWERMPVLVLCNHCANPACVKVCPTGATWKRKSDGVVMMDMHRCIGCRYCMAACPYGARSFNWRDPRPHIAGGAVPPYPPRSKGVVEKCTFCDERLREGLEPLCVEAAGKVPGGEGALVFGDVGDPESPASRILKTRRTACRRPGLGTGPSVYYIV